MLQIYFAKFINNNQNQTISMSNCVVIYLTYIFDLFKHTYYLDGPVEQLILALTYFGGIKYVIKCYY